MVTLAGNILNLGGGQRESERRDITIISSGEHPWLARKRKLIPVSLILVIRVLQNGSLLKKSMKHTTLGSNSSLERHSQSRIYFTSDNNLFKRAGIISKVHCL